MKRLTGSDAMMLYAESDNVPTHTVKVAIVDRPDCGDFSVETVREGVRQRLHRFEPMRRVLVGTPYGLHRPMWQENCAVDLAYHVRALQLPSPGGRRELDDAVAGLVEQPLDRTRPLWEIYVIDGLADGQLAVVTKIHHALADGLASANLLAGALDRPEVVTPYAGREQVPSRGALIWTALNDHLRQITELPGLVRYTAAGVRRSARGRRSRSRIVVPRSFLNHRLSEGRRFATASVPFADAKILSRQLDCTLNDLILALAAGATRELRLRYDGHSDVPLVAMVPACLDPSSGRSAGNNFAQLSIPLPAHLDDALGRVAGSRDAASNAKQLNTLRGPELLTRWIAYIPPAMARTLSGWLARTDARVRMQNLVVSNVRGPGERIRVAGATITEFYSVGPLVPGSGLNITVWSYADQLNITVLTDTVTVADAHEVTAALTRQFEEISAAARVSVDQDEYRANVA